MEVRSFENAGDFLKATEELLNQNESFYNLKLGISQGIKSSDFVATEPVYVGVFENNTLIGCGLRTNANRPLAISCMPKLAIDLLVDFLIEQKTILAGVVGEVESVNYFKDLWLQKTQLNFQLNMHLGVYEAQNVIIPESDGEIIVGDVDNREIIYKFVKSFILACFPNEECKDEEVHRICSRHMTNQTLFLLKNSEGQIVSMAANTRGSTNGGTISLVYTPPEYRGKSYGSLVTALVTQKILSNKKFANLFTDLKNPTSNSIYQKIGYKKIGENIHYDFLEKR